MGVVWAAGILAGAGALSGCGHADADVPKAEVKTFEAYGLTLGPDASPQQVAYVLLKSIADDYAAARAKDHAAQKKAQELTYSVAAPGVIEQRLVATANAINPNLKKQSLGEDRDAKIFKTVHYWAPIVGHYVPTFANADFQTVARDSWVTITPDGETAHVYYPVSHDPAEKDPDKAETATISIELNREAAQAGGPKYWRVSRVRYLGRHFKGPGQPLIVEAYGVKLDDSATPDQVAGTALRTLADMLVADKNGDKDKRASDLYRLLALSHSSQGRQAAPVKGTGEMDEAVTRGLLAVATRWIEAVRPVAESLAGQDALTKPAVSTDAGDRVNVVYASGQGPVTVQLGRQQADGKVLWRVTEITGPGQQAGTAPAAGGQPQPAQTQPQ